jgi:hypothetical protein
VRAADPLVRTAERAAPHRASEDRIFRAGHAVVVLDGASQPDAGERDGGWLAETLGRELQRRLMSDDPRDLTAVLGAAIGEVARTNNLSAGAAPSTTVSIVRWDNTAVDVLVLGDSPVVALTVRSEIREVRDDRLRRVAAGERERLRASNGDRADWRALVAAERARRNTPGGYWIAESDPAAARHARIARWDRGDLVAVLAVTDGVSIGVDRYGVPPDWAAAFAVDPAELVRAVHAAEESDPDRRRWPRSKVHDDKAAALVRFRV